MKSGWQWACIEDHPDLEIIKVADQILTEHNRSAWLDDLEFDMKAERQRARRASVTEQVVEFHALKARLVQLTAKTRDGLAAKARVLKMFSNCSDGYSNPEDEDALAWSLCCDVLQVPHIFRAAEP